MNRGFCIILLTLVSIAFSILFYCYGHEYLNFMEIKKYNYVLLLWESQHYLLAVLAYMLIYIMAIMFFFPGVVLITLIGGFLFGFIAVLYVVLSATIGSTILVFSIRTTFSKWLIEKKNSRMMKMQKGFQDSAFNYLILLRLIPLVPFSVVNIAAALFAVRLKIFMSATLLGIIPGVFFYVMLGDSLNMFSRTNPVSSFNPILTHNGVIKKACYFSKMC